MKLYKFDGQILSMLQNKRKTMLLISAIAICVFILALYISTIEFVEPPGSREQFFVNRPRLPLLNLFLLIPLLVLAITPLSYYVLSKRLEEKLEKNLEIIAKLVKTNRSTSKNAVEKDKNVILKFLNPSERNVIEMMIRKDGEALQSEISRTEGMSKLKTHRAVSSLEKKGIIKRETFGKTYRIILENDVKEIILK